MRNILHANSDVSMAFDEMNMYEPLRKNTLDRLLRTRIVSVDDLMLAIGRGSIYGTFWQSFEESGLNLKHLQMYLQASVTLNEKAILAAVLELLRGESAVRNAGVKYPVHFSKLALLERWFPEAKIIVLLRNPKGMIASKLNDAATQARKNKSRFHRFFVHYTTLLFFAFEFRRSVRVYLKHQDLIHKVHYESLVMDPESTVRRLCEHCRIRYEPTMLSVTGKDSSFGGSGRARICAASLDTYQNALTRFDQWLIDLMTSRLYLEIQ